jgi:hypothetical protein
MKWSEVVIITMKKRSQLIDKYKDIKELIKIYNHHKGRLGYRITLMIKQKGI